MPNITISLQDDILKAGREYAQKHRLSLNSLIRDLLAKTVVRKKSGSWIEECFRLMDRAKVKSVQKKWKREDLYRV